MTTSVTKSSPFTRISRQEAAAASNNNHQHLPSAGQPSDLRMEVSGAHGGVTVSAEGTPTSRRTSKVRSTDVIMSSPDLSSQTVSREGEVLSMSIGSGHIGGGQVSRPGSTGAAPRSRTSKDSPSITHKDFPRQSPQMTNVARKGASSRRIRSPAAPSPSQLPPELAGLSGLTVTRSPRMTAAEVAARLPSGISVSRIGDNDTGEGALLEPKHEVEVITID